MHMQRHRLIIRPLREAPDRSRCGVLGSLGRWHEDDLHSRRWALIGTWIGRGPPCMHSRAFPGSTKNVTALHLVHQGKEKWGDKVLTMPAICEDLEPNEGSP